MKPLRYHSPAASHRQGFTLAEAAVSTLIVATMMVSALTSIQKTGLFRRITTDQHLAFLLGQQMLAEIQCHSYVDPTYPLNANLGPDLDETANNRTTFDDVDDYNGWLEQPPAYPDGTPIPNRGQWYRKVKVEFVRHTNLEVPISWDDGLKRITVETGTVTTGGQVQNAADRKPISTVVAIVGRGRM